MHTNKLKYNLCGVINSSNHMKLKIDICTMPYGFHDDAWDAVCLSLSSPRSRKIPFLPAFDIKPVIMHSASTLSYLLLSKDWSYANCVLGSLLFLLATLHFSQWGIQEETAFLSKDVAEFWCMEMEIPHSMSSSWHTYAHSMGSLLSIPLQSTQHGPNHINCLDGWCPWQNDMNAASVHQLCCLSVWGSTGICWKVHLKKYALLAFLQNYRM